jgi:hypothetical protein
MKTNDEEKVLVDVLFREYKSLTVTPHVVAKVTNRSEVSLERDRAKAVGIPFTKLGRGTGSDRVLYNIYDVASFVVSRKVKVMS